MSRFQRGLAVTVMLVVFVGSLHAQEEEKPIPPRRTVDMQEDSTATGTTAPLPKIDLPEFVITGNESIVLPEFGKTAIEEKAKFDPSLKRTGPGQRESTRVDLGKGGKEELNFPGLSGSLNGKVMAGYGSFQSPYFDGWFGKTFKQSDILLKGGYRSSDGHIPHADFRRGYIALSGGMYLPDDIGGISGNKLGGSLGYQGNSYRMYGSTDPDLQRTVQRFMADVTLNSSVAGSFTYNGGIYLRTTRVEDGAKSTETAFGVELTGNQDFDDFSLKGDVAVWGNRYKAETATGNPYFTLLGASVRYRFAEVVDLMGGAGIYLTRASDLNGTTKVYPKLSASWYATRQLTLFVRYEPYIQRNSLSSLVEQGPYLSNDAVIRHPDYFTNVSAGTEAEFSEAVNARLAVNYKQVRNNPVFLDPLALGVWTVSYFGSTRIVSLDGEVYADLTDEDNLGVSFSIQSSKNSQTGSMLPYFPRVQVNALYQHRFPFGLTLGSTVHVSGRQYADPVELVSLPAFTVLDLKAGYMVVPRFGIDLMVNNVLNSSQVRWNGYSGVPRTIALGINVTW